MRPVSHFIRKEIIETKHVIKTIQIVKVKPKTTANNQNTKTTQNLWVLKPRSKNLVSYQQSPLFQGIFFHHQKPEGFFAGKKKPMPEVQNQPMTPRRRVPSGWLMVGWLAMTDPWDERLRFFSVGFQYTFVPIKPVNGLGWLWGGSSHKFELVDRLWEVAMCPMCG